MTAYDYDPETGTATNARVAIDVGEVMGVPDGMTIDTEGMLWVAHYGGSCVRRWNPQNGTVLQTIEVPASRVTACTFGGFSCQHLFITTATEDMDAAALRREPMAGSLFVAAPDAKGRLASRFAG